MTENVLAEREIIRSPEDLTLLCAELKAVGCFALDTEFMGERTYVPRLSLVQVATRGFIALIDTLAIRDLSPLWALIADPQVIKVLHAAREDLRLAYYGGGRLIPQNIFDTQIGAGLVGLPLYPLSYARLVDAIVGVKLDKSETRSDWERRPLTPDQIRYARDDVRYLLPIKTKLERVLEGMGRTDWMAEEMKRYAEPGAYEPDPEQAYLRLRGPRAGLTARPTALLRAVAAWREREAAARDIPARILLRDEALTELALRPPRRLTDFRTLRQFPPGEDVSLGPAILEALSAGRAVPDTEWPAPMAGQDDSTPTQRALGDLLYALGTALCLARDLAPELVLSRTDALMLARGGAETPLLQGWRRIALGAELSRLAHGESQVQMQVVNGIPQVTIA